MENFDNILNGVIAKLLSEGFVKFSQNGLDFEASYDNNGGLSITACLTSPNKDDIEKLNKDFKDYVDSLSDEFFIESAEAFAPGELKKIEEGLTSDDYSVVKESVNTYMTKLKEVASNKITAIDSDISDIKQSIANLEKDLEDLTEIKESYAHVLTKEF